MQTVQQNDLPEAAPLGFMVGHIISVTGAKVTASLVSLAPDPQAAGRLNEAVQIGALVKMPTTRSVAIGIVSSLATGNPSPSPELGEQWVMEIDLFGEYLMAEGQAPGAGDGFDLLRGVSLYPGLGDAVYATGFEELKQIYKRPKASNVRVGTLHQEASLPAFLVTDDLLGKHFAILGTTGSGKSCALATVLHAILGAHPFGHVVLLDPHNEYQRAFTGLAEVVTPENLQLPYWLLNFEEMVEVLCSRDDISRSSESFILRDAIHNAKRSTVENDDERRHISVDTPVPYPLSALLHNIEAAMGQLQKAEQAKPYLRLRARIETLRVDRRYAFMFSSLSVRDTLSDVISRIIRVPVNGKPLTIFDLSGVPAGPRARGGRGGGSRSSSGRRPRGRGTRPTSRWCRAPAARGGRACRRARRCAVLRSAPGRRPARRSWAPAARPAPRASRRCRSGSPRRCRRASARRARWWG
jgi:hypothetical protein